MFGDCFTKFAVTLGGQIHLKSLRDAFATVMPVFIMAGLAVLINNVVFTFILSGEALANAQYWGIVLANGTLNIAGLLICPVTAYCLSNNKDFKDPLAAAIISMVALVVMMPNSVMAAAVEGKDAIAVTGVLTFGNLGTTGMFGGIIIGLAATELFIFISNIEKLQINLGENIPPAVGRSFSVMLPAIIVLSLFGMISAILQAAFGTNLITLIATMIQEPLRKINTSLPGSVFIYSFGNFLFTLGIHQTVVNGVILEPLLLANMNENMLAFANGEVIPHIINSTFIPTFGMFGGTGSTFSLLLATFIFGKSKVTKDVAKLSIAPGLFNINEPVIFGYPIVFNVAMMIPFVLLPAIGIIVGYIATAIGFMNHCVVLVPWTTPPILNAYLATGGDIRAVVVQLAIIIGGVFLYLPFMKINERVMINIAEEE